MKKTLTFILFISILCITLTACTSYAPQKNNDANNTPTPQSQTPTSSVQTDVIPTPPSSSIPSDQPQTKITADQAKNIALQHAQVSADKIYDFEIELDNDDAIKHYELEFKSDGYEYSYNINAQDGKILHSEKEFDD